MKVRIELDPETGDYFIQLPEDLIEEYDLEVGDVVTWEFYEDDMVKLTF